MPNMPGQQFSDWTSVPSLSDAWNKAKSGHPSVPMMLAGSALLGMNSDSQTGKTMQGAAVPTTAPSPVVPPGVQQPYSVPAQQMPQQEAPQYQQQPAPQQSNIPQIPQGHPLLDAALKLMSGGL